MKTYPQDRIDKLVEQMAAALATLTTLREASSPNRDPKEGEQTIHIYWAGCRGLADLATEIGRRVSKIGVTTDNDIAARLKVLGMDRYGALKSSKKDGEVAPGFEKWIAFAFPTDREPMSKRITMSTRSISVVLPPGVTRRAFDEMLHGALSPWSLDRNHPTAKRWTAYQVGEVRVSQARELYVGLDPRTDGNTLLAVVEGVLEGYVQRDAAR